MLSAWAVNDKKSTLGYKMLDFFLPLSDTNNNNEKVTIQSRTLRFAAKSVRTSKFSQEGICPLPQATLNGQIP